MKQGLDCNKKKDCGPGCYPCGLSKVHCSHVATGRGSGGSPEEDLITTMEEIWDDNKMWVDMWMMELAQRVTLEDYMVRLLKQQCESVSMLPQQFHFMWNWFVDYEDQGVFEHQMMQEEAMVRVRLRELRMEDQGEGTLTGVEKKRGRSRNRQT
jgi:hypothetical protein